MRNLAKEMVRVRAEFRKTRNLKKDVWKLKDEKGNVLRMKTKKNQKSRVKQ